MTDRMTDDSHRSFHDRRIKGTGCYDQTAYEKFDSPTLFSGSASQNAETSTRATAYLTRLTVYTDHTQCIR
jgi:hypothetical protein